MSRKVVAVFGPPGSGKSSLIEYAKRRGYTGFDLETAAQTAEERRVVLEAFLAQHSNEAVFIGTADLLPEDFPNGTMSVMLLPSKKVYLDRLAHRDAAEPIKAGQEGERKYDDFVDWSKKFEHVIRNDGTIDEAFDGILSRSQAEYG